MIDQPRPTLPVPSTVETTPAAEPPSAVDLVVVDARAVGGARPDVSVVAGELVAHVLGELPVLAVLEDRERLLAAAWLASLRSARTRRSYAADLLGWRAWLAGRGVDVLAAGRVHAGSVGAGAAGGGGGGRERAPAAVGGRVVLPVLPGPRAGGRGSDGGGGAAAGGPGLHGHGGAVPGAGPGADRGRGRRRRPGPVASAAAIRLLLHNALRVDEVLGADIADLGTDRGHQVLTVLGKGNRRAKVPLTPATVVALHAYLDDRATQTGLESRPGAWRSLAGPLLATTTGGRMRPSQLWELVRRLAHAAGITEWDRLSAHSLRHTGITLALDAGVPLRDVQDYARHRDARTTRRYDHSRDSLDRSAAYAVAAYLG